MGNSIRIARLFGIDIEVHPSWFLILALFVWSFATSWFDQRGWSETVVWAVALATALIFFASVLLHELAHSLVARAQGIHVRSISLFLLGGVATLDQEASSPGREAVMAAAGPAASAVVGGLSLWIGMTVADPDQLSQMLLAVGSINLLLTVFNLLPGFPLDGGRVLHAAAWKVTGDRNRAMRFTSRAGIVFGWLVIGSGVLLALADGIGGGLWMAFIGWTMLQASKAALREARRDERGDRRFAGVTVAEVMSPAHGWAPGSASLETAARDYFAPFAARYLPVVDEDGRLEGVADLESFAHVVPSERASTTVRSVMTPFAELDIVAPDVPADEVVAALRAGDGRRVVVVDGDRLVGFVDHAQVAHFVEAAGRS